MYSSQRGVKILGIGAILTLGYPLYNLCLMPDYRTLPGVTFQDRTAIVTGATGNLGSALVYSLAKKKMRVIMACRDIDKCKSIRREIVLSTSHNGIACRHLDLEDIDSITRFTKEMEQTEPHIDILINNAAVKNVPEKEMTKYGIEKNYFINFIAPYLLTFSLMNKLTESAALTRDSRIINVVGKPRKNWNVDLKDINFDKRPYEAKQAYNQSKLALAYFTILLDKFNREKKNCVYVFGVRPCSNRITEAFHKPITLRESLKAAISSFIDVTPGQAIQPAVKCAMDPELTYKSSGLLYGYFLAGWGWGKAEEDENKAKLVWNNAAELLLNSKDVSKKPSK